MTNILNDHRPTDSAGSDLRYAPPPISVDGRRLIFVDFLAANYVLRFSVLHRSVRVRAEIEFIAEESGSPMFELNIDPEALELELDDQETRVTDYQPKGALHAFKAIQAEVSPGVHRMALDYRLETLRTNPSPLQWSDCGVQCTFAYSDIVDGTGVTNNRFMGSYLPSNMEFDHFKITMDVAVEDASDTHSLVVNTGEVTASTRNQWTCEYPSHFTTSFPYFDLVPTKSFWFLRDSCDSIDGRSLSLLAYAAKNLFSPALEPFIDAMKVGIRDMENNYGPFPYGAMTVRAMPPDYGGGMEYAGATLCEYWVIRHELQHCYFARCIAPVNGDSGWIDEAIAAWEDYGFTRLSSPPEPSPSGLISGNAYARSTQGNAYTKGAEFLAYLDHLLADCGGMRAFLREYFKAKRFESIDVEEFLTLLEKFAKRNLQSMFDKYVYGEDVAVPLPDNNMSSRHPARGGEALRKALATG